ncbi:hypothetical protein R6Q57_011874 [Mikania cordata]
MGEGCGKGCRGGGMLLGVKGGLLKGQDVQLVVPRLAAKVDRQRSGSCVQLAYLGLLTPQVAYVGAEGVCSGPMMAWPDGTRVRTSHWLGDWLNMWAAWDMDFCCSKKRRSKWALGFHESGLVYWAVVKWDDGYWACHAYFQLPSVGWCLWVGLLLFLGFHFVWSRGGVGLYSSCDMLIGLGPMYCICILVVGLLGLYYFLVAYCR